MGSGDITQLIQQWQGGDPSALDRLTPYVYDELKRLARSYMRAESPGHTLQATALINEAFVQLAGAEVPYADRSHFVATAAKIMRRVLVDHARSKRSLKQGGEFVRATLHEEFVSDQENAPAILEMDMALEKLARKDARLAAAVELVFFGGLTYDEAAHHLGVGRTTLYEDLRFAKAWLGNEMGL
ncbi:MAG: sigma-70 family RNA polymerase sigma factor [Pseudomonadota bacterium]